MPIISDELRDKHLYIAGKSGYGKTTLLQTHIKQDMDAGRGLCFVDPNGDAVDDLLNWVPERRIDDCVLFDTRYPRAIDFLSCKDAKERSDLLSDIADIFNLENAQRAKPLLIQLLGTLLDAKKAKPDLNISFFDVQKFIQSKKRREDILSAAPHRREFYPGEFKPSESYDTILTRMIRMRENQTLCHVFSGIDPLNIYDLIQERKIFFVRLQVSDDDFFIGALIIKKIQQMAMRRPKSDRVPYFLYVDEFENVQTAPFKLMLKQGRKFKLCLTIANQVVGELTPELRQTAFGTASSFIIFHIQDEDTKFFKSMVPEDEKGRRDPSFLAQLSKFRALYKLGDASPGIHNTPAPPPPPPPHRARIGQIIINRTREKYRCDMESVMDNAGRDVPKPDPSPSGRPKVPPHGDQEAGSR